MRILVTGGAGYVGSHTVDLLLNQGHQVVVLDNLSTGHRGALHPEAVFVEIDLLDRDRVMQAMDSHPVDGIIHFASYTLVGESMQKPWLYLRDNLLAASNIIEAAVSHGVKSFILSSTSNLFGGDVELPIKSETRPQPASPYGESKFVIERMLYWMKEIHGLNYCCLRYFNAAGAHPDGHIGEDHTPETHLIPLTIQTAMGQREELTVFGDDYPTPDGTCIRDYIHVVDLASAHLLALEALQDGRSRTYNLGNGSGYSILQVIQAVEAVSGRKVPYRVGPRRPGDPAALTADASLAERELGWQRRFPTLEAIVETAWRWHSTHPQGYGTNS